MSERNSVLHTWVPKEHRWIHRAIELELKRLEEMGIKSSKSQVVMKILTNEFAKDSDIQEG